MALIGRIALVAAIVAAPWPFGSVTPGPQWALGVAVACLWLWRLVELWIHPPDQPLHIPSAVVAAVGILLIAALQLVPREEPMIPRMRHAVLPELAAAFANDQPAYGTVAPASTRTQASLLFFAIAAFLLGAQWFSTPSTQVWLWSALAVNGALLGFFGIVQKLTWNGLLFWSVPLRAGGTPFASFVNRNNAAGYLNLCLAGGMGCLLILLRPRSGIESDAVRRRSALPWKAQLLRGLASVNASMLGMSGLIVLVTAAVLFSLSRGGILALAVAAGWAMWRLRGLSRRSFLVVTTLLAMAVVGMLFWVGGWNVLEERLVSLSDPASAIAGRWNHWRSTSGAIRDFPMLGTGLGTYRYANLPYQTDQGHAWYFNADNLYFELLVEMGIVGFVLLLGGAALAAFAAGYLLRQQRHELRAVGMVGMFTCVTQGVQALTDFGLLIPANALTLAVLAGSVCGTACATAEFHRPDVPLWLRLARLSGRRSQMILTVMVLLASAAFGLELFAATQAAAARNVAIAVNPNDPLAARAEPYAAAIKTAEQALQFRPDDAELHRTIALWWINSYRVAAAHELQQASDLGRPLEGKRLWQTTSMRFLGASTLMLNQQGRLQQLNQLRDLPLIRETLLPARRHLQEASRYGPLTRDVAQLLADLSFLAEGQGGEWTVDTVQSLKRAMFVAPSSAEQLIDLGTKAELAGARSLSDQAFRRSLEVSDEHADEVWKVVSQKRPAADLLGTAIPNRVSVLIALAEGIADDVMIKRTLALHTERLLNEEKWEDPEAPSNLLRARLAEVLGHTAQAIEFYRAAIQDNPLDLGTRLRLAHTLLDAGRVSEARAEMTVAEGLSSKRSDLKAELRTLKERASLSTSHEAK